MLGVTMTNVFNEVVMPRKSQKEREREGGGQNEKSRLFMACNANDESMMAKERQREGKD
jgi:hypothetical protein